MRDRVFAKKIKKQFEFNEEVAAVFDDMLDRSIPFYKEMEQLSLFFAQKALADGGRVYDLGCSTATLLISLAKKIDSDVELIGLDSSEAMLSRAKKKCEAFGVEAKLLCEDILEFEYKEAKLFISNYTLQFIRPLFREKLLKKIYLSLSEGGIFIFSEKIISNHSKLNRDLIECYYDFKKMQGYSEFEIAQKREALENVLVPYSEDENIKMAKDAGFSHCEVIFRWVNFATFIAYK